MCVSKRVGLAVFFVCSCLNQYVKKNVKMLLYYFFLCDFIYLCELKKIT
jgi:hypothetical protein